MSRVRLVGAMVLLAARTAAGQDAAAWRDSTLRLGAALDSIRSRMSIDSTLVEIGREGDVRMFGPATLRARGAELLSEFNRLRHHWFGDALPGPDGFQVMGRIRKSSASALFTPFGDQSAQRLIILTPGDSARAKVFDAGIPNGDVAGAMVQGYAELMTQALPPSRLLWLINTVPVHLADEERRSLAMYGVVTSTGRAGKECVAGNLTSCRYALGLEVAPDEGHTDAFAPLVRADLLAAALGLGGPEAWQRFATAPRESGVGGALAAAARVSRDSLVSRWRSSLLSLRPKSSPVSAGWLAMCAGWTMAVVLATLGASRWR